MGTAAVQPPTAAPKPQPAPPSPWTAHSGPGHPPAPTAMAVSELEAAIAALPGKRDSLREAYDRLAACSPSPLPFAWEDLDAHLSSLQASFSLRFRQLQVLEAARTAPADAAFGGTRRDRTTGVLEEEKEAAEEEEMQEGAYGEGDYKIGNDGKDEEEVMEEVGEVEEVPHDKFSNEMKDEEVVMEEEQASEADEQDAEEEMQVADEEGLNTKDALKASPDKEEQDTNVDVTAASKASAMLGKEEEETSLELEQDTNMDQMSAKKAPATLRNEEEASMEQEQGTNMDEMAAKEASAVHCREEAAVQGSEVEACSEKQEKDAAEQASEADKQDADEEMQVADEEGLNTKDAFKSSPDKEEQDTNMDMTAANKASAVLGKEEEETSLELELEQDTNMDQMAAKKASAMLSYDDEEGSMEEEQGTNMDEMAAKEASAVQGKEVEACSEKQEEAEEHGAHEVEADTKNATKGEAVVAKEVSRDQGNQALPDRFNDRTAACTSMDAQRLFKLICTSNNLNSEVHNAVCHAPDAAALALQVVELFLHNKIPIKTNKVWANCVGLIKMVPLAVTKPSADTNEQAKRVARDWYKMIGNPGSCTVLGNLSSCGLLYFLISYNIVSEFDTKEIFHLVGTIPRKKWTDSAFLIKDIGLTDRIPELMDYLIENGQQRHVLHLARVLNLVDKYSPLSLLKGYVGRAEQTAMEISEKNMTHQSLRAAIIKEIDNLERALDLAKHEIADSSLYTSISAQIFALLHEFEEKERSLANASTASTSNSQQQQIENKKKREKVQEQKKIENNKKHKKVQQQGEASKLREELAKKRNKPQQEQQQKQQDKPKEKQQQKQQDKPNEKQQNKQKCTKRKQASSAARSMAPGGHFGYPPYATMHHNCYRTQPVWPGNHFAAPFVPQLGAPGYIGPVNLFYSRPEFCPW